MQLYVPAAMRKAILSEHHNTKIVGHLGRDKTLELLGRRFYWPGMKADVEEFCRTCPSCQRNKPRNRAPQGLLLPIDKSKLQPWEMVGIDFIVSLPPTPRGFDAICTVTCHFTKMSHFVPFYSNYKPLDVAHVLLAWVFRLYGYPRTLVSDRDPAFTSAIWQELHRLLGTKLAMSTSYQPQSDGQAERVHRSLEEMLNAFVDAEHANWDELLPICEFSHNNSKQRSTGKTPFQMLNGRDPPTPAALLGEVGLPRELSDMAVAGHLARLCRAWDSAREALQVAAEALKRQADRKARPTVIKAGDQVNMETKYVLKARAAGGPKGKFNAVWVGPSKCWRWCRPMLRGWSCQLGGACTQL